MGLLMDASPIFILLGRQWEPEFPRWHPRPPPTFARDMYFRKWLTLWIEIAAVVSRSVLCIKRSLSRAAKRRSFLALAAALVIL